MDRFRYGEYHEGPDPLAAPYDVRAALDELGRDIMAGTKPLRALRDLLRRGTQGISGLDDLLRRTRERRERIRSQGRLDGTLDQVRSLLDRAIGQERAELFPDPSDDARLRETELDSLPADTAAAVRRLSGYQWRSADAARSFAELRDLLRREVLDTRFRGMKEALQNGSPEDMRRVREMIDALNDMLDADQRGEHTQADFDRFMDAYGDFFPEEPRPRDLEELVDTLARRSAAAQRMMDSLTPEQRAELNGLMQQATAESGMGDALDRLAGALRSRRPDLAWSGGEEIDGPEGLGAGDATSAVQDLADLAELEASLGQGYAGAGLDDIDEEAVRRALGRPAVDDLARLRALERELRDQGYLEGTRNKMRLTPKAVRRLGETALREVFTDTVHHGRPGAHAQTAAGSSGEPTGATRPWEFGDEQPLDAVRTLGNAVARGGAGPGGAIRMAPGDFEVAETERRDAAAVCLLVDLSYSMALRDLWGSAKQTAMALHSLVTSRFPQDAVQIIGFSDYARELPPAGLAELTWEPVQGTNLQHALILAGRHLDRHSDFEPIVLIVTDGEPTAHLGRDGEATFAWPPSQDTTTATLAEVDRMTRRGAALNVFLLADDPRLERFVDEVARRNGGRVVRPATDRLGGYVVRDFLSRRRRTA
ncbi:VWA domain-containing protein [Nocardiopsis mangrovi]|uniref:VWA domain-containing protein n=1 Tax=Nocardiopsis mangrovi TaxID=1179818 RepID=A0ABV9DQA0_9ACTN